jgi:hypothetical protein
MRSTAGAAAAPGGITNGSCVGAAAVAAPLNPTRTKSPSAQVERMMSLAMRQSLRCHCAVFYWRMICSENQ